MKKYMVSMIAALSFLFAGQSAMAGVSIEAPGKQDLVFAFSSSDSTQVDLLSEQEMMETEGKWWFIPVMAYTFGGGVAGSSAYLWSTPSNNWSLSGFGRAFGSGATAGFYSSPMGRPLGAVGRTAAGAFGSASWYTW